MVTLGECAKDSRQETAPLADKKNPQIHLKPFQKNEVHIPLTRKLEI
jgi:hypothetical protein